MSMNSSHIYRTQVQRYLSLLCTLSGVTVTVGVTLLVLAGDDQVLLSDAGFAIVLGGIIDFTAGWVLRARGQRMEQRL